MNAEESLALQSKARDPRYNTNDETSLGVLGNPDRMREKAERLDKDNMSAERNKLKAANAQTAAAVERSKNGAGGGGGVGAGVRGPTLDSFFKSSIPASTSESERRREQERRQGEQPDFFAPMKFPDAENFENQPSADFFSAFQPSALAAAVTEDVQRVGEIAGNEDDVEKDAFYIPKDGFYGTKSPPVPGVAAPNGVTAIEINNAITASPGGAGGNAQSASTEEGEPGADDGEQNNLRQRMESIKAMQQQQQQQRSETSGGAGKKQRPATTTTSSGGGKSTGGRGGIVEMQMSHNGLRSVPKPGDLSERSKTTSKPARNPEEESDRQRDEKDNDRSTTDASSYYYSTSESSRSVDQYGVRQPSAANSRSRHRRRHHQHRRSGGKAKEPTYEDFQAEIQRKVKEEELTEKREMLMLFYEKEQYEHIKMTRKFTIDSDLNEMRWWYYKLIRDCRINDEVEHLKMNLIQGSRFLLFINSTVLKNPLNLRMGNFPHELSVKLNTEWDRHLRDYVKSKCGISGPKPNPIRNLAWGVVNHAINYHREQLAKEEAEESKKKRELEQAAAHQQQAIAGAGGGAGTYPPQYAAPNAYRIFTGARENQLPFHPQQQQQPWNNNAFYPSLPAIDNTAPIAEQYRQLEQWQAQQQQQQQQYAQQGKAAATTHPAFRQSPMYAPPQQQQPARQQQQQATPQQARQQQQVLQQQQQQRTLQQASVPLSQLAQLQQSANAATSARGTLARSPPPPTFSTQRNALRNAVTQPGAGAVAMPAFMRPPATGAFAQAAAAGGAAQPTGVAALAGGVARQQDFRPPTFGSNRNSNPFAAAAPFVGNSFEKQQQQQQTAVNTAHAPQPPPQKHPLAPPVTTMTNTRALANVRAPSTSASYPASSSPATAPQLPQAPSSRNRGATLTRDDVSPIPLPQAPSPRAQPVDIEKLEQMQERLHQQQYAIHNQQQQQQQIDPATMPHVFQEPKPVPPLPAPQPRNAPPSPVKSLPLAMTTSMQQSTASTPMHAMAMPFAPLGSVSPPPMLLARPMMPKQSPSPSPAAFSPAQPSNNAATTLTTATAVGARKPLPPPKSLAALRENAQSRFPNAPNAAENASATRFKPHAPTTTMPAASPFSALNHAMPNNAPRASLATLPPMTAPRTSAAFGTPPTVSTRPTKRKDEEAKEEHEEEDDETTLSIPSASSHATKKRARGAHADVQLTLNDDQQVQQVHQQQEQQQDQYHEQYTSGAFGEEQGEKGEEEQEEGETREDEEQVENVEIAKPLDQMSYDELLADMQRLEEEDDSDQEYDDLIAGENGAPIMTEVQANDKVSEVMGLMSEFVDKNPGAAAKPEKASNLYEDIDSMLLVSAAESESAGTSLADMGSTRHHSRSSASSSAASGAKPSTSVRRKVQHRSTAPPSSSSPATSSSATRDAKKPRSGSDSDETSNERSNKEKHARSETQKSNRDAGGERGEGDDGDVMQTPRNSRNTQKVTPRSGRGGTPRRSKVPPLDHSNISYGVKGTMMLSPRKK